MEQSDLGKKRGRGEGWRGKSLFITDRRGGGRKEEEEEEGHPFSALSLSFRERMIFRGGGRRSEKKRRRRKKKGF